MNIPRPTQHARALAAVLHLAALIQELFIVWIRTT